MKVTNVFLCLIAVSMTVNAGTLVSVDWKNANGVTNHGTYSGVETLAAAANPFFGAANVWNTATLGYLSPETNPSFSGLLDSDGNATTVGFQFTGSVDSFASSASDSSCTVSLFCDFIYLNEGSLDWTITGLAPNASAFLYFYNYGSASQGYRVFNMALDTDGDSSLDGNFTVDAVNGVYAANIVTSATGTIKGQMQCCLSGQASWSGFQIVQPTPEPATLALFGGGLAVWCARRKLRR